MFNLTLTPTWPPYGSPLNFAWGNHHFSGVCGLTRKSRSFEICTRRVHLSPLMIRRLNFTYPSIGFGNICNSDTSWYIPWFSLNNIPYSKLPYTNNVALWWGSWSPLLLFHAFKMHNQRYICHQTWEANLNVMFTEKEWSRVLQNMKNMSRELKHRLIPIQDFEQILLDPIQPYTV